MSPESRDAWAAPGAYPVGEGIHRIPLPLPVDALKAVNVYVVETADGLTLIDGGWAMLGGVDPLARALGHIGYSMADVRRVLVTHAHRDHYTLAVQIRREYGARVLLGLEDRANVREMQRGTPPGAAPQRALAVCGAEALLPFWEEWSSTRTTNVADWEDPDDWIETDGPVDIGSREVAAMHTPGHTAGHLVFAMESAGVLFAGDHILPAITPSIGYEPVRRPSPLGDFLTSLARVRALPDMTLLPAHGPSGMSVHARIDELLQHHRTRLDLSLQAAQEGSTTAYEVAQRLPWTRRQRTFAELGEYNQVQAILETWAHLEVLVSRALVARTDESGVHTYRTRS